MKLLQRTGTLLPVAMGTLVLAAMAATGDRFVIGMTGTRKPIEAVARSGRSAAAKEVLVIGGLRGRDSSSVAVEEIFRKTGLDISLTAIPLANPDGAELVFPPAGTAYRQNPEAHFLWRWIALHAPDLVVEVGDQRSGLAAALAGSVPVMTSIPKDFGMSPAHVERNRRLARTPREVAEELAKFYGHDFEQPVYIPAMSLIGRLRLGETGPVEALVAPYIDGRKDSLLHATPSHLAGQLVFAELARSTHDIRYMERVKAAAELASTDLPVKDEMSDGIFMGCPLLASAGELTGNTAYFDQALMHFRTMQKLCRRPDGLYRHSPLNDAAWGRGNGFPALGVAWTLSKLPPGHPGYAAILRDFQEHMAALAKYQDREGMWHEVIDEPGSYAEFSATAMIATAMLRGVRNGWLDRAYQARVQRAWRALLVRMAPEGVLIDVCESTGKQKTREAYLDRAASFGKDARGGGMALLLATEMMTPSR